MVNVPVMNGGSQLAGRWTGDADDAVVEAADDLSDVTAAEDEVEQRPDRWPLVVRIVAILAGIGWLTLLLMSDSAILSRPVTPAVVATLVIAASPPLVLIALFYLLAVRRSRGEAARFARVSGDLRGEQGRLTAALVSVATRLDAERADIAAQTDRLMAIGDDAADRLRAVADRLKDDIGIAARTAETLRDAAQAARSDMTVLLGDLPRAHAQTLEMSASLEAAGLAAIGQAGALDSQVAALVARGREADEVAGGAAQKLAATLARVESLSESAGARLTHAAETMTTAIDAALGRAAEAGDAVRQGMEAQGAAMRALVDQSEAALTRTGVGATEALSRRIDEVTDRLEALGAMLIDHEQTGSRLIDGIGSGIDRIDTRFAALDTESEARHARLTAAVGGLAAHAQTLKQAIDAGSGSAEQLIGRTETLVTALGAASREIDEALPQAFARLDGHADATRTRIDALAPDVSRIEQEASRALDRLLEAEAALAKQRDALDALGNVLGAKLQTSRKAADDLLAAVEGADARAREIADGSGATLVEAMVRVRETAQTAAERAREALAAVVPDSAERLSVAVRDALRQAVTGQVEAQIGELAATAERAVASANTASDRLMRQMLTIAETSAQVEARIGEARTEIEEADRDNFSRRVALLIESLNSTAIDVTKILSNDVTDSAWGAYLKGDRGVFTRRAVRLLDGGEVREINRHYNEEPEFRDQVNRYVRDFEAMLRNVLATRAGSPLGVTLLSSDMGKLYVALAQAIERLRT